jgi:Mg/Co/Ni transporter MgtE
MLVKDIMATDIIYVKRFTTLGSLLKKFKKFHTMPVVPVVDDDMKAIGSVSFDELIDAFQPAHMGGLKGVAFVDAQEPSIFDLVIEPEMGELVVVDDFMQTKFLTVDQNSPLEEAYDKMKLHQRSAVPVIDKKGKLVGMIGIFDVIFAVFRERGVVK